ncbi:hypothetical protein GA0074692_0466 [Micromonospora pallida]|uniref:Uncharacterized protein n=1 Tax=Micromonospora pallida TaxID=145854 RepID=A0A1C6RNW6_9ACTN|nr:hypothetical protein [Micromonospora pallida]SCL18749.1 hypothetical protein GA0074692_0466 [Micromonospora pallida]
MKIDEQVEVQVRSVLDAVVHRNAPRLEETVREMSGRGILQQGTELAVAISGFVLFEIHDGLPSRDQINELAGDIAEQEAWMSPSVEDVRAYLTALAEKTPLSETLPHEAIVVLPYLVAANLLATASKPEDGEWWFKYLDKVEAAIEAAG